MLKSKALAIFMMLLLTGGIGKAQTFSIPDPNFRAYLATLTPSVLNSSQQLLIQNAKNYTGSIRCSGLNIQNLSGIQYFHRITQINCSNNQLTSIPSLDSLFLLTQLYAFNNQLSSIPKVNHLTRLEVLNVKINFLTFLPSLEGMIALKEFDCSLNSLYALPEINSLVNLEELFCYDNQITTIPDLRNLIKLKIFNSQGNQLTRLPDLSQNIRLEKLQFNDNDIDIVPGIDHLTFLEELIFSGNKIKKLPDLSKNKELKLLFADGNLLTKIPDLSAHLKLIKVQMESNQLSFEDIISSINHPNFTTVFDFAPQDTLQTYQILNVVEGAPLTIKLELDNDINNNTYTWYKNQFIDTINNSAFLVFNNAEKEDEGEYTVSITNSDPKLNGIILTARVAIVTVSSCINASSVNYTILNNECGNGATIQIDNSSIIASTPLSYNLISLNNQQNIIGQSATISNLMAGSYSLLIKDANNCSINLKNYIYIPSPNGCSESFTPNGDGVEDTYYISKNGVAKIYDKNGALVYELQVPAYWDGKDKSGKLVNIGYYIILVNGEEKTGVVLID